MSCCDECFEDSYLKKYIKKHGAPGYCDFCNEDRLYCIDPYDLHKLFRPVVDLYPDVNSFMPTEILKEYEGSQLHERLNDDWGIFSSSDADIQEKLLEAIDGGNQKEGYTFPIGGAVVENENEFRGDYGELEHEAKIKWRSFCEEIRHKNRFFLNETKYFEEMFPFYENTIDAGTIFYRARSSEGILPIEKMGMPPVDVCSPGRGNPEGIAYLYLASSELTAVSEIKPYIGDRVTVGEFPVDNKLKVVDLRQPPSLGSPFQYGDSLQDEINKRIILRHLSRELSRPIRPDKGILEYLPIQYVCELIKSKKYDGVLYDSSLADGYNLLCFRDQKCVRNKLLEVNSVVYDYKQVFKLPRQIKRN